jgi:hypothetical protein
MSQARNPDRGTATKDGVIGRMCSASLGDQRFPFVLHLASNYFFVVFSSRKYSLSEGSKQERHAESKMQA